jgi:hypothetical protein
MSVSLLNEPLVEFVRIWNVRACAFKHKAINLSYPLASAQFQLFESETNLSYGVNNIGDIACKRIIFVVENSPCITVKDIQTLFPVEAHRQAVSNAHQLTSLIKALGADSKVNELAEENFFNVARMLAEV